MNLVVEGFCCLGSFGLGIDSLRDCLTSSLVSANNSGLAKRADTSSLGEFFPARTLRQMDHFSRMALLAFLHACRNAGIEPGAPGLGIVLATGYGPATPTFQFLDSFMKHGELLASPLSFSHSVHNIPVATLAMKTGMIVPCTTVCQGESSVASGLLTAAAWLAEGRVSRVLFGAVDEQTPFLAEVSRRLAVHKAATREAGYAGMRRDLAISEAAVFFCLSNDAGRDSANVARGTLCNSSYGRITESCVYCEPVTEGWQRRVCHERSVNGALVLVSGAVPKILPNTFGTRGIRCLAPAYGNVPVAQALDLALVLGGALASWKYQDVRCLSFSHQGLVGLVCATPPPSSS